MTPPTTDTTSPEPASQDPLPSASTCSEEDDSEWIGIGRVHEKASLSPLSANDNLWKRVSNDAPIFKKAAFYVGNLRHDLDEDALSDFIQERCMAAGNRNLAAPDIRAKLALMPKKQSHLWAHITVPQSASKLITSPSFWPGRVYYRPWHFKERPNQEGNQQQHLKPQQHQQQPTEDGINSLLKANNSTTNESGQQADSGSTFTLVMSPESDWGSTSQSTNCDSQVSDWGSSGQADQEGEPTTNPCGVTTRSQSKGPQATGDGDQF